MVIATGLVVALSLGVSMIAGPLTDLALRAAADLLEPGRYIRAVLG